MTVRRFKLPPLQIHMMTEFKRRLGVVYFFRDVEQGLIKIGFTTGDPRRRLRRVAKVIGSEVEWVGYFRAQAIQEIYVHNHFHHLHISNECFRPDEELLRWMNRRCPNFEEETALEDLFRISLVRRVKTATSHIWDALSHFDKLLGQSDRYSVRRWLSYRDIPSSDLLARAEKALQVFVAPKRADHKKYLATERAPRKAWIDAERAAA